MRDYQDLKDFIRLELDEQNTRSERRHEKVTERIDKLVSRQADTAQVMANVSYIFSDKGPWIDVTQKVEKHHQAYQKGKTLGGLMAAIVSYLGWDTVKNHLHWFKH